MTSGDFYNAANWQLAYQEYKEATQVTPLGGYLPLPAFEIPITFDSRVLIVKTVSNIPAGKRWKWAGNLTAFQSFPNGGVNSQKSEVANHSLYLNRSKRIIYPNSISNFELVLSGAYWLRDLQLTIYEFIGEFKTYTESSLDNVKVDLSTIEQKIDNLTP